MDVEVKKFRGAGVLKTALLLLAALLGLLFFGAGTARAEEGAVVYGLYDGRKIYACDDKGTKSDPEKAIDKTTVTNVFVADGVTSIDYNAFYNARALKEVTFPDTVEEIRSNAFEYCTALTTITIPDKVEIIYDYTFMGATSLTSINLPENLKAINRSAFDRCTALTTIALPKKVEKIGTDAFRYSGLTSITLSENLKRIEYSAFESCRALTTITLPDTIEIIQISAFENSGLTGSINLPENLQYLDSDVFGNTNLTHIVISGANPPNNVDGRAFLGMPSPRYMVLTGDAATSGSYGEEWQGFTKTKALGTDVTPSITAQTYTGSALEPGISGTKDIDYKVTYENNTNVGAAATAHITTDDCYGMYTGSADVSFTINPAPLTIEGLSAQSRPYDGSTAVALTGGSLKGIFGSDDVSIAMPVEGTVAEANKGTEKPVTYTLPALQGSQKDNYSLTAPELKAEITAAPLTIEGLSAQSRPYDGSTAVTLNGGSLKGVIGSEDVSIAMPVEGTVADASKGTGKAVTYTPPELQGSDKGNYSLTVPELKADITPAPLTLAGGAIASKTYDGTTGTAVESVSFAGLQNNEALSKGTDYTAAAAFTDAAAGADKAAALTVNLMANDKTANYTLDGPETIEVKGTIDKATPAYDVPEDRTAVYGQTLKDVALPQGFSWQDDESTAVGNAGSTAFKATYTPADTANYQMVTDIEVSIEVSKATSVYDVPENRTAIYGQTLKDVNLPEGFSWQNDESTAVGNAGSNAFKVTYTPADPANYQTVADIDVTIEVSKATPAYELPKDRTAVYGQTLKDVTLPEGFSWQADESTAVGNAGSNAFKATYTPADPANYQTVADIEVTIEVSKATPAYDVPENRTAIYGQTLKDVTLPQGFSWQDDESTAVGNAGSNAFKATYTPADPANYQTIADIEVTIEVSKATPDYDVPENLTAVYGQTLKDVNLPAGFSWQDPADTTVGNVGSNAFKVTYTPADPANYQTIADIEVTIGVSKATPAYDVPENLNAIYGQTLKDVTLPEGFSWQADESTAVGNAGSNTFKATYTPADPANYQTVADIEVTITVSRGESTLVVQADKTQFTYGEAFTLTVDVTLKPQSRSLTRAAADTVDFYLGDPADGRQLATAAVENSKATATIEQSNPNYPNGGSADITVVYNGSGSLKKSIGSLHLDITPANGSAQVSQAGWTYGQAGDRPVPVSKTNRTDQVTYAYKTKDADDSTYQAEKPTAVGQYTLQAVFAATQNYKAVTATADFAIAAAAPVLTITPEGGKEIQVGEPVTLNIDVKGVKEETPEGTVAILDKTLTLKDGQASIAYTPADTKPITLTAVYTPAEGENYTSAEANTTLTAGKKTREPIILEDTAKTYGDPAFNLTPTGGSLQAGEAYTCQSDDEAVAVVKADGTVTIKGAGTAHITVSVAESSAWNPAAATMTLTVGKAKITGVSFEDAAYTEDSAEHKIELTGSLPEGTSVSYENNVQKAPGAYTAKALIDGGVNYESLELTAVLTINEKPEPAPTPVQPTPGPDTTSNPKPENTTNNTTERTTDNTNTGLASSGTAAGAVLLSLIALTGLVLWQKSKKQ